MPLQHFLLKKQEDWKNMVNLERYHVMSEEQILEKLNRENPSRNMCTNNHAMMAWEYLEEPINENESDHENCSSPDNKENCQIIQQKKKKLMMNSQNHLPQLIMIV